MFPPPEAVIACRLDEQAFRQEFRRIAADLKARAFKLERRQTYQEPGNPAWEALVTGQHRRSVELIEQRRARLLAAQRPFDEQRVPFYRVRVVERPMTLYLRWEFHHYRLNAELGERIHVVEQPAIAELDRRTGLDDFLLFDDRVALVHDYSPAGLLRGGALVHDPAFIRQLQAIAETLLEVAVPFESYAVDSLV